MCRRLPLFSKLPLALDRLDSGILGHSQYIFLRSTSPWTCRNCVRQEKKSSPLAFIFKPTCATCTMGSYECKLVKSDQFSPMRQQGNLIFFFPPTRQKYACRDPLTVKYSECDLNVSIIASKC